MNLAGLEFACNSKLDRLQAFGLDTNVAQQGITSDTAPFMVGTGEGAHDESDHWSGC